MKNENAKKENAKKENDWPLFIKNIEFLRDLIGVSRDVFCGRTDARSLRELLGVSSKHDSLSMHTLREELKKYHVLRITKNTYDNYKNKHTKHPQNKQGIVDDLNELIEVTPYLKQTLGGELTEDLLFERDLEKEINSPRIAAADQLYSEKFIKNYLAYYSSTNITGQKSLQLGVLHLAKGERDNLFEVSGIFGLTEARLPDLGKWIEDNETTELTSIWERYNTNTKQLTGTGHLSLTCLWLNFYDSNNDEFISFSFDLSEKITTMKPQKAYLGSKGLATSKSSGVGSQTVAFPIIIAAKPLDCTPDQIINQYLHFDFELKEGSYDEVAKRSASLIDDLSKLEEVDETLRKKLIAQIVKFEVEKVRARSSLIYITPDQADAFYQQALKPLRKEKK